MPDPESKPALKRKSVDLTEKLKKSKHKKRKKHRKRAHCSSSDSSDSTSDSTSSYDSSPKRKHKKAAKERKHSKTSKKNKHKSKKLKKDKGSSKKELSADVGPAVTLSEGKERKGPMTKEEWEKQQSETRRVYDPDTGRMRLVKGSGEIIEEIVSREQQQKINKLATQGDGISYSLQTGTLQHC